MSKNLPYVYWLTHKETNQFYIGYREANSLDPETDLPIYKSSSNYIADIGFEHFSWMIIAQFFTGQEAFEFEQKLIEEHINNPLCLNRHYCRNGKFRYVRRVGDYKASYTTRQKISLANKGKIKSDITCQNLSKSLTGRVFSDTHKLNLSKSHIGRTVSSETKIKISSFFKNRKRMPHSDETKAKMKESAKHRIHHPMDEETKNKIRSKALCMSDETKEKISAACKERWKTRNRNSSQEKNKAQSDSLSGRKAVYRDGIQKRIKPELIPEYVDNGWSLEKS